MLFTSYSFIIFLLITGGVYYCGKSASFQLATAIVASLVFYAWNFMTLLVLLLITALINAVVSYCISISPNGTTQKRYAVLGLGVNLSILCFFKYGPLFGKTIFGESSALGAFLVAIPLPLGISFYILQGISLIVDTFREKETSPTRKLNLSFKNHITNVTLFISFFPQLIAGPIVKAREFIPQIKYKSIGDIRLEWCFKNLVLGYFLKMFVADNLKDQTVWIAYPYFESFSAIELAFLLIGYTVQIFADFAGYSLIAIGLAGLFGYELKDNFKFPFIAVSFSEFWRRWHISLSTFLMEYLYIPLGGNRKGSIRTYLNLIVTMTLGGLWHGAVWSFALWGLYHGIALATERLFRENYSQIWLLIPPPLKGIGVFSVFAIGLLFYKLPELSHVGVYLLHLFVNPVIPLITGAWTKVFFVVLYVTPVALYHALYWYQQNRQYRYHSFDSLNFLWYGVMLFFVLLNSGSPVAFFYFQF